MNISEFRKKYPQYDDIDDQTLSDKLYDKYYSDVPRETFNNKFLGVSKAVSKQKKPALGMTLVKAALPAVKQSTPVIAAGTALAGPKLARPALEMGGAALGGVAGGAVGGPVGAFVGESAGFAGGSEAATALEAVRSGKKYDVKEGIKKLPAGISEGALYAAGGRIAKPVLKYGSKAVGKVAVPLIGKLTGAGTGAVEEALKNTKTVFLDALRGKVSGEDVVSNAHAALNQLKDVRSATYLKQFEKIGKGEPGKVSKLINPLEIQKKVSEILPKFVNVTSDGTIDWSRSALGPANSEGVKKIKDIVGILKSWGSKPGDRSIKGLDMLKRQLDDFYSESSNARAFVSQLKGAVKNVINKEYPAYSKMTKNYAEATSLIKDIESGLMMRKQGMTGRIVADQTLRRLVSAMRDNFPLRKELVNILGEKGGQDIAGQVAGHTLSPVFPRGLAGTGPAIVLEGVLTHINPAFASLMALSSPRLMGEFLHVFGKGLKESKMISKGASKLFGYGLAKLGKDKIDTKKMTKMLDAIMSATATPAQALENKPDVKTESMSAAKKGIEHYTNNNWSQAIKEWQKALKEEPKKAKEIIGWINTAKNEQQNYRKIMANMPEDR